MYGQYSSHASANQLRTRLEELPVQSSPERPGCPFRLELVDGFPIVLSAASVDIDLLESEPTLSLPQITATPEEKHDRQGQVRLEESVCIVELGCTGRSDGDVELGCERDEDEEEASPGACDTKDMLEGNLVDGVAMGFPSCSEPDVCL